MYSWQNSSEKWAGRMIRMKDRDYPKHVRQISKKVAENEEDLLQL